MRFFVFSRTPVRRAHEPEPAQEPESRTHAPRCPGPRAARCARARTRTSRPGLQGYAVMAGIVVDQARGQRGHRRRRQHAPRLHRRHRRQRARPLAPDVRRRGPGAGRARSSVGSFTSRGARRAGRAAGRHAARARRPPAAALLGRRRGGRERAAPRQVPHRQVRVRQLLGRLPRQDDGRAVADGLDVQGQARARWCRARTRSRTPTATAARSASSTRAAASPAPRSARKHVKIATRGRGRRPSSSSRCRARPATSSRPRSSCPRCESIADELGALLIADEMITGLGRTGTRWGVDHTGVVPDIVTIGKAFGGGFPLSGAADDRRDRGGQAVGQPVGLVVELRRQPAGRGGRRGRAADHRRGEAGRERARRRRGACCASCEAFVDRYPFVGFVDGARPVPARSSWSRTRRPRSRCRAR